MGDRIYSAIKSIESMNFEKKPAATQEVVESNIILCARREKLHQILLLLVHRSGDASKET